MAWRAPDRIDCPEKCRVPEGKALFEVPRPRHAWADILLCPNEGCGKCFLMRLEPPSGIPCASHGCQGQVVWMVAWPGSQDAGMCVPCTQRAIGAAEAMGFTLSRYVWEGSRKQDALAEDARKRLEKLEEG